MFYLYKLGILIQIKDKFRIKEAVGFYYPNITPIYFIYLFVTVLSNAVFKGVNTF